MESGLENLSLEEQKELKEKQEQEDINNSYNNSTTNTKSELNKQMEILKNNNIDGNDSNVNSEYTTDSINNKDNNSNSNISSNENTSNDTLSEIDSLPSSPSIRSSGVFSASSSSSFSNLGALVSPGGQAKLQQQQKRKVIEGELVKRGHIFPSWRTRWFKIENGYLLYFKSKEEPEPIDRVPLRGSRVSKKPFHDRPNTFELFATTMRKVFLLQAKDVDDLDFWIDEIIKEIEYTRSLYSRTIQT
ncbi:hypothetical protein DICPUDRAFT_154513 [Dictyostelium purpureum]|uniref:PH domain-containing protein n=1 Tax=Dictyostelium purpureum TaxID=5786 RepID=F0ZRI9_DICPU|nr:uncharacterized protein DICPUDRAFT_154513 [Dictyostelium purpureum]EGC33462.1 hypothetical protein DICPUDRAFT_154513 [Dictyostelium purpureum]|eukprot:XP_003290033.1 hypothetical protein DICPUDRAFT_154513 [Dictyostelium purpureum]